jgi:hypothetical protein
MDPSPCHLRVIIRSTPRQGEASADRRWLRLAMKGGSARVRRLLERVDAIKIYRRPHAFEALRGEVESARLEAPANGDQVRLCCETGWHDHDSAE